MIEREFFEIPSDWEYRGEGNSHVVLGLPKLKKVLRIRKRERPRNFFQWFLYILEDYISWWYDSSAKIENRDICFHLNVMRPLLGFEFVSDAKQVKLSRKQTKIIDYQLAKIRPDFRKHRILHFGRATLFHDFTTLETINFPLKCANDTFSIEIKPKKGWIPFGEKSFPECIFCMNQYVKLETRRITEASSYCPKNLFSGYEIRMKKSILSLIENPQNNLRIFKNGSIIYGENKGEKELEDVMRQIFETTYERIDELLDNFSELLFNCLTRSFESPEPCEAKLFCKWDRIILGDCFPNGCILEKILSVQMLDVEGTKYYSKLMDGKISQWGYVDTLLDELSSRMCVKCTLLTVSNTEDLKRKDLIFAPYLVAAVANDCSLMISLKKIKDEILLSRPVSWVKTSSWLVDCGQRELLLLHLAALDETSGTGEILVGNGQPAKKKISYSFTIVKSLSQILEWPALTSSIANNIGYICWKLFICDQPYSLNEIFVKICIGVYYFLLAAHTFSTIPVLYFSV